jgi:hypothetical protein
MIKDTKISEIFQIPPKMLQRWKNANDYRYLIYTYLHNSDTIEVESFFRYLATKKAGSYDNNKEMPALKFLYKKEFVLLVQKHIGEYLGQKDIEVFPEKKYATIFTQKDTLNIGESSFMVKEGKSKMTYVEIGSRVLESKPLRERLSSIQTHLKERLYLKKMLFISNEKQLPVYLRSDNVVKNVRIDNISIDAFANEYLGVNKIIFVPSTMKIPSIQ